jgi:aspartate racemase
MTALTQLGLLGGMSWESTALYYRELNRLIRERVGGHASAPLLIWSVDFAGIEELQRAGDWQAQGRILADAATKLEAAGVGAIALATNTLHLVAEQITDAIDVPFVDLIDVTAVALAQAGHTRVGLLATDYTMTSDLYPKRLAGHGIEVIVPNEADRALVHRVIYAELLQGVVSNASRAACVGVIERLVAEGADAVLLACTELGLLLEDGDASVPLPDTTLLHCAALADVIISGVPS